MRDYHLENLSHDPIHGYIPFTSGRGLATDGVTEREIIDHRWVQRLRQIHQLQTAWWVYPTAEHTRFPHVLGAMHLASRAAGGLVRQSARRLSRRAQSGLRRDAAADGRTVARRRPRAVRPLLRRAFLAHVWVDARDARRHASFATSWGRCCGSCAVAPTIGWRMASSWIRRRSPG